MTMRAVITALAALVFTLLLGSGSSAASADKAVQAGAAAGTATAAPARAQLLCGAEDWGVPPEHDLAEAQLPDPPPYAGWRRTFSAGGESEVLTASGETVLICVDQTVYACDLASGALRWSYTETKYSAPSRARIYHERVFVECYEGLIALELANGKLLWGAGGAEFYAVGDAGVWASRWDTLDTGDRLEHIVLLDAATGRDLHVFDASGCNLPYGSEAVESDYFATKHDGAIHILLPDGTDTSLPSSRPDWAAAFVYEPGWLLVGECPDYEQWRDESDDGFSEQLQAALADPATGQPGAGCIISRYTAPAGQLCWRREVATPEKDLFNAEGLKCIGNTVYQTGCVGERPALSLRDGSDVANPVPAVKEAGPGEWLADGGQWYYTKRNGYESRNYHSISVGFGLEDEWAPDTVMRLADLDHDNPQPVFPAAEAPLNNGAIVHQGYIIGPVNAWGGLGYASVPMIYAIALGPDGKPQEGTLALLTQRDEHTRLVDAFVSRPDPLSDAALMRGIVTTGINAIERCMARLKPEDAAHWDALLTAAVYITQHRAGAGQDSNDPVELLLTVFRAAPPPAYQAHMLRWLRDPSLAPVHNGLSALLARTAGLAARPELDAYYTQMDVAHHVAPRPQMFVSPPPTTPAGGSNWCAEEYDDAGLWAEARGADGAKYALFPAAGLASDRDLYLAVDTQADGVWDEVLPTGLQDVCFAFHNPGRPMGPGARGKLALSIDGGVVKIMHHRPLISNNADGAGAKLSHTKWMDRVIRYESRIELADLRRDSDGDGLTDVMEEQLYLDPHNPDMDCDGIPDGADAAPNANPARMGRIERGIARALTYFFASGELGPGWWGPPAQRGGFENNTAAQPWSCRYLLLHGCGPVSYCGAAGTYSICLNTRARRDAYRERLKLSPQLSAIDVGWETPGMDTAQLWHASALSDIAQSRSNYEDATLTGYSSTVFSEEPEAALVVSVEYCTAGYIILLVNIDGEYYPYHIEPTWEQQSPNGTFTYSKGTDQALYFFNECGGIK
jgi:hypothetical protein